MTQHSNLPAPQLEGFFVRQARGSSASVHRVALSGGLDSTVLLHLAARAQLPGLHAVHVHHGLQAEADAWAEHCAALCAALAVPLTVARVQVPQQTGKGPEAAAREVRFTVLHAQLADDACLMLAHHQQDQAETLLLRLLRGTGLDGLGGMQAQALTAEGLRVWRPLLEVPRAALLNYAEQAGLRWIEDPHNQDPRYARSWLRLNLWPQLTARYPQAALLLARAGQHLSEARQELHAIAHEDLARASQPASGTLNIEVLHQLSAARRKRVIRLWLQTRGLPAPFAMSFEAIDQQLLAAKPDSMACVGWPGAQLRRYRTSLYAAAPLAALPENWQMELEGSASVTLPADAGTLQLHARDRQGPWTLQLPQGGERIRPIASAHHRSLKQLAQAAGIPPWIRARMPMIFSGKELVSIAGLWHTEDAPVCHWHCPAVGWPLRGSPSQS